MVARLLAVVFALVGTLVLPLGAASAQLPPPPCAGTCPYSVSVNPVSGLTGAHRSSTNDTVVYTVKNMGANSDEYTLTCSTTGGVSCTSVSNTDMPLASGASQQDTVVYSVGSTFGTVSLKATGTMGSLPHATSTGTYTVEGYPTITLVTPVGSSGRAVVHNRQPVLRAIFGTDGSAIDTTKTLLIWRSDTVTVFHSDTLTTARHNRGLIEWDVDSLRGLGLPDSAKFTVRACALDGACVTASEWVVLLADQKPVLGFTGVPLEALGRQFTAPLGGAFSVSGVDVQTGFSIPDTIP